MVHESEFDEPSSDVRDEVEPSIDNLTENASAQVESKVNQAMGNVQETLRDLADDLRETVADKPLSALAIVGGVCFALGFLVRLSLSGREDEST